MTRPLTPLCNLLESILRRLVFPLPEGPMIARISPGTTTPVTPFNICLCGVWLWFERASAFFGLQDSSTLLCTWNFMSSNYTKKSIVWLPKLAPDIISKFILLHTKQNSNLNCYRHWRTIMIPCCPVPFHELMNIFWASLDRNMIRKIRRYCFNIIIYSFLFSVIHNLRIIKTSLPKDGTFENKYLYLWIILFRLPGSW